MESDFLQFNHERTRGHRRLLVAAYSEDTFDKIDFEILAGDTRLYVEALHRLLTEPAPSIPARLPPSSRKSWSREPDRSDLSPAIERTRRLEALLERIEARCRRHTDFRFRARMVRTLRPVLRAMYQERGPYQVSRRASAFPDCPLASDPNASIAERTCPRTNRLSIILIVALRGRSS
jgi:hypothetical protein